MSLQDIFMLSYGPHTACASYVDLVGYYTFSTEVHWRYVFEKYFYVYDSIYVYIACTLYVNLVGYYVILTEVHLR